jgi:hypothetical protein
MLLILLLKTTGCPFRSDFSRTHLEPARLIETFAIHWLVNRKPLCGVLNVHHCSFLRAKRLFGIAKHGFWKDLCWKRFSRSKPAIFFIVLRKRVLKRVKSWFLENKSEKHLFFRKSSISIPAYLSSYNFKKHSQLAQLSI